MKAGCTEFTDCRAMLRLVPWWISGSQNIEPVGESYRQEELAYAAGGATETGVDVPAYASLIAEKENPHDPDAVAIFSADYQVAYLSRKDAARFHQTLLFLQAKGYRAVCHGRIVGGWRRVRSEGHFGIKLRCMKPLQIMTAAQPLSHNGQAMVLAPEHRVGLSWVALHQPTIQSLIGGADLRELSWFPSLRMVAANPHDQRAQKAWVVVEAKQGVVGYLPPKDSLLYAELVNSTVLSGQTPNCAAVTRWTDQGYWNTSVYLPE